MDPRTIRERLDRLKSLYQRDMIVPTEFAESILIEWVEDADFPAGALDDIPAEVLDAVRARLRTIRDSDYRHWFFYLIGPGEPPGAEDDPLRKARLKALAERLGIA